MDDHAHAELVEKIRKGDEDAFTTLYETYWKRLFAMAYSRLSDVKEAEDVVSDLFFDLWRRRDVLTIHTSLEAYLSVSVKHRVLDVFRLRKQKEAKRKAVAGIFPLYARVVEEHFDFDELYRRWEHEVNRLPAQCRLVHTLSQDGLTNRQIAEKLSLSERTVENHKHRALKILRVKLTMVMILAILS